MLKIIETDMKSIKGMASDYYNNLIAPMDDLYEVGIIPACNFFEIEDENGVSGFFATNGDNVIVQFFVKDKDREDINTVFEDVISQRNIERALCGTYDPIFYSLCENRAKKIDTNDHLFCQDEVVEQPMPFDGIVIDVPGIENLDEIMTYNGSIEMTGEWVVNYMTQRINQKGILLFRYRGQLIGTGEIRPSISSEEYANVGMSVSCDYRKRGLGSYILSTIRKIANERGYKAICSANNLNRASINTINKSGFVLYHTIDEMVL